MLKKTSARLTARTASPVESLRLALQQVWCGFICDYENVVIVVVFV